MGAPLISFGMPVYNGAQQIAAALDSLLAQDHQDLEIFISDNASTDDTEAICRDYVRRDPRVRYDRNPTNIGANRNFNRAFAGARGAYFAWAAHDDRWDPRFASRCLAALEARPDAVLALCQIGIVDQAGRPLGAPRCNPLPARAPRADRFVAAMEDPWWGLAVYGLARTEALRGTGLHRTVMGGDKPLIVELSLLGDFVEVPEVLWWYDEKPFDTAYRTRLPSVFQLGGQWAARFPYAVLCREYLDIVRRAALPGGERAALAALVLRWYFGQSWLKRTTLGLLEAVLGAERTEALRGRAR